MNRSHLKRIFYFSFPYYLFLKIMTSLKITTICRILNLIPNCHNFTIDIFAYNMPYNISFLIIAPKCLFIWKKSLYWVRFGFIKLHFSFFNLRQRKLAELTEFKRILSNPCILYNFTVFLFRTWIYAMSEIICHVPSIKCE